jgi:hypothetical protein
MYEFKIDQTNMVQEFTQAAPMVSYYCELYATARRERDLAKLKRERVEAAAWVEQKALTVKGTVADIQAAVAADQNVIDARLAEVEADYAYTLAHSNVRAAETKKDMLQSLGAHIRADMQMSGVNSNGYNYRYEGDKNER